MGPNRVPSTQSPCNFRKRKSRVWNMGDGLCGKYTYHTEKRLVKYTLSKVRHPYVWERHSHWITPGVLHGDPFSQRVLIRVLGGFFDPSGKNRLLGRPCGCDVGRVLWVRSTQVQMVGALQHMSGRFKHKTCVLSAIFAFLFIRARCEVRLTSQSSVSMYTFSIRSRVQCESFKIERYDREQNRTHGTCIVLHVQLQCICCQHEHTPAA